MTKKCYRGAKFLNDMTPPTIKHKRSWNMGSIFILFTKIKLSFLPHLTNIVSGWLLFELLLFTFIVFFLLLYQKEKEFWEWDWFSKKNSWLFSSFTYTLIFFTSVILKLCFVCVYIQKISCDLMVWFLWLHKIPRFDSWQGFLYCEFMTLQTTWNSYWIV